MAQTLLNSQRQGSITPSLITNRLHNICKHLTLGRQEDAHEFLRYLVEQMEKSYLNRFKSQSWFKELDQYSKETTPLNQILGGYLRSTVTCLACKYESITFQHFEDLPLDISRVSTLNEALSGYFARENLEECGYKCESCKKRVSATKRFSLERAPAVLCIQLKRFNVMGGKLSKQIQISQNLNLEKHLAKSGDPNQNCYYKLVSLVTHLGGSASGGHYTAIGLAPSGNYYQFDDSYVNSISTESVLKTNAYVLFYELVSKQKQNGHSSQIHTNFYQNEHTYSKIASSTSTSATPSPKSDFDKVRESSFAKPILPKLIAPSVIIKQNNHLKQKENETTPPMKMIPSTSKNNGISNNGPKAAVQLFPAVKSTGVKREASDDEDWDKEESASKKLKPSLPSLPRLTAEEMEKTPVTSSTASLVVSNDTPPKPKSLVPYETDDEDDESSNSMNGVSKIAEADRVNFCKTSSGVFVETDLKENSSPSKHGSTVDKIVITKASLTNGSTVNGNTNGKSLTNGYHVKRNDDTIQQLAKLNHSGYGTTEVFSWNNTSSSMNREVNKDQEEDRKRQLEDDNDFEMDSGRMKKIKHVNRYHGPSSSAGLQGKLPNPFQEQQNVQNQNGSFRPYQSSFNDRLNNKSYHNGQSQNRHNGNGSDKYNKGNYKQRDGNYYNNGYQNRYNGNNKFHNGNKRYYDRR